MSNNLPVSLTALLGRESETATLHQLICQPEVRLVTITGPSGVGKTSLALHVAHAAQVSFSAGVFFVSLAPISNPALIIPTIAQTLHLPESPRKLRLDSLKEFLNKREILLLLDNFEQIIAAAPLLSELLSACPRLKLLVTSREALRLRGEQEFLLSPLEVPDQVQVETLLQSPAIALFVQRAQSAQLEFQLTPQNAAAVVEICARLDGLPLALELAAARIKLLPPQAMLAQLQDSSLQLLTGGARDLPARQQTLSGAIQWSYDLLGEEEQRTFRWLAVFVGGSTLEAAQAVIGPTATLDMLDSLVSKSLLGQVGSNGAARLEMLETIREFGWQALAQAGERQAARRAHADYYLALAEEAEGELVGADQKNWLQRLDRELDNLRAGLQWAFEFHEIEMAQRLAGALVPFWLTRSHLSEGRHWLEETLAMDGHSPVDLSVRAKVLYGAGTLARFQSDYARARMLCTYSLELYRAFSDQTGVLKALVQLGRISEFQDDQSAREAFLSEAAAMIANVPDSAVKARAYTDMAIVFEGQIRGQFSLEAVRFITESERINRSLNNRAGLALALLHESVYALFRDDATQVSSKFGEAERLADELGDDYLSGRMESVHALFDLRAGNIIDARRRVENLIELAYQRGENIHLGVILFMLAEILYQQGLLIWSARLLGMVETFYRPGQMRVADNPMITHIFHVENLPAELSALLGEQTFANEFTAGQRLTLEDLRAIPHPAAPTQAAPTPAPAAPLTRRELEVLHLLAEDLNNPQIAERLVISRRTVDAHLRSIYEKLNVKSRAAALQVAQELGLLANPNPSR